MPIIIDRYRPNFARIFEFFAELSKRVAWTEEKQCLGGISRCLASFYSLKNAQVANKSDSRRLIEFSIFDLLRSAVFRPVSRMKADTNVLATLPQLYKIFERCWF